MENALTNREIAALFWMGAFLVWGLSRAQVRASVPRLLRAAEHPAIIMSLFALLTYVGLVVFFGYEVGAWSPNMTKHTLIWLLGPALVMVVNMHRVWKEERFFRRTARGTVTVSAALAVVVNFCILSLPAELALQPTIVLLVMMSVYTSHASEQEYEQVRKFVDFLLGAVGIAFVLCGGFQIVRDLSAEGLGAAVGELLLPAALTIAVLPFLYLLALYAAYESAFLYVRVMTKGKARRSAWQARLAILAAFHLRVRYVGRLAKTDARDAATAPSFGAAWRDLRATRRRLDER